MRYTIAAAALAACLSTAAAQDAQVSQGDSVTQTRLFEAMRNTRWNEALVAFGQLEERSPRMVMLSARAHYELNAFGKSAHALQAVLEANEDHLPALYLLARIRARQGQQEAAKDLLCSSARAGQSVLRDVFADEHPEHFKDVMNDPKFLVRLMRLGSETCGNLSTSGMRDPFAQPRSDGVVIGDPDDPEVRERSDALEAEIKAMLAEFRVLAHDSEPDFDALRGKLKALRALLDQLARLDLDPVSSRLKEFEDEFKDLSYLLQPLRLELYVADGNQHLRTMAALIRQDQFEEALERRSLLQELCTQMRRETLSVFHGNADQLTFRGDQLARRARLEIRAAALPLAVTGIVIAPDPEPSRVVINDRIYEAGDPILDPSTDEEIDDLELIEVSQDAVRFRLADLEFVRALKRR